MDFTTYLLNMKFETHAYFLLWTISVIYSIYRFSYTSFNYFRYYKDEYDDFTPGISFLSSKRDKADLEWESIIFLIKYYFTWLLIYICISHVIRTYFKSIQVLKLWQIIFTTCFISLKWNYIVLMLIISQPIIFHISTILNPRRLSIWITSGLFLVVLNYFKSTINNSNIIENLRLQDYELYVVMCSLFWMNLKCTSFCLETERTRNFIDIFSYCLYPPTVLSGPFIMYKDYKSTYNCNIEYSLWRYKKLAKNITKTLLWCIFVHICLHFIYVGAATFHSKLIQNLDSWSLYGFGYTMGQFFHLKYLIQYGMSTGFASFENVTVPSLPRCIGRIHLYSEMWKYFDPGLYTFLIRNIYIPIAEYIQYKFIRSFLCFFFVYIWHGLELHIAIWAVLNFSGILAENFLLLNEDHRIKTNNLQQQSWKRRKNCFAAAFLLTMSAISNFYFFAGTDIGNIFFRRIFQDVYGNVILIAVLYCCCQVSTEIRTVPASRM